MSITQTILSQLKELNITRALRSNGYKVQFVQINENTLRVHGAKRNNSINVDIELTPADLYDVAIHKMNRRTMEVTTKKFGGQFAEDFTQLFVDAFKLEFLNIA